MAIIESLSVSGGFLDDLNIAFASGLNVIIGPRGAGKTSVVELLRFCLGSTTLTERLGVSPLNQARAVLGDGVVRVVIRDGGETVELIRGASDDAPRLSPWARPFILAQNEIESIGLEAKSRVALIDGFGNVVGVQTDDHDIQLRALQSEIDAFRNDLSAGREQLLDFATTDSQLVDLKKQQKQYLKDHSDLKKIQDDLQRSEQVIADTEARAERFEGAVERLRSLLLAMVKAQGDVSSLAEFSPHAEDRVLEELISSIATSTGDLRKITEKADERARSLGAQLRANVHHLKAESQPLRFRLQQTSKELSTLSKQLLAVETRAKDRDRLLRRLEELTQRLTVLERQRSDLLSLLHADSSKSTERRLKISEQLNAELGPRIRVEVVPAGSLQDYTSRLTEALRGSGVHASRLAPQIAKHVSPEELVTFVERDDSQKLAKACRIAPERARRLVDVLGAADLGSIIASRIEDDLSLQLLDGSEYKDTMSLSTGQRCTVVLPILLSRDHGPLVLDQPEDHLDNAFIVETLVQTILIRKAQVQIICTSHNANIPVLGEADLVVHLESDGRRGYVRDSGSLEQPDIIESITSIMEGGRKAFKQRADFYAQGNSA